MLDLAFSVSLAGFRFLLTESAAKRLELSVRKHLYRERGSGGRESRDRCGFTEASLLASICVHTYGKPCLILLWENVETNRKFDNTKNMKKR